MSIRLRTAISRAGLCVLLMASPFDAQAAAPAAGTAEGTAPSAPKSTSLCDDLYPAGERSSEEDGITILSVHILPDGTMTHVAVLKSSGKADFDTAAVQCAERAKVPQKSDGEPIEVDWVASVIWRHRSHSYVGAPGVPMCKATHYPVPAIRKGEQGTVEFAYQIGTDGRPANAKILKSSGYTELDEAALGCSANWQFPPATQNGEPVPIDKNYKISFGLWSGSRPPTPDDPALPQRH